MEGLNTLFGILNSPPPPARLLERRLKLRLVENTDLCLVQTPRTRTDIIKFTFDENLFIYG